VIDDDRPTDRRRREIVEEHARENTFLIAPFLLPSLPIGEIKNTQSIDAELEKKTSLFLFPFLPSRRKQSRRRDFVASLRKAESPGRPTSCSPLIYTLLGGIVSSRLHERNELRRLSEASLSSVGVHETDHDVQACTCMCARTKCKLARDPSDMEVVIGFA